MPSPRGSAATPPRGGGYGLLQHARMAADPVRREAYRRALAAAVRPGCVVLEIGTGCGLFALEAARLGARMVYAVEPDDVIQLARDLARENGLAQRISFIQDVSTAITLPEPADVLLWDLRGALPLFAGHLPAVSDARARHLRADAVLINAQDTIYAALVDGAEAYAEQVEVWQRALHGYRCDSARQLTVNAPDRRTLAASELRVRPQAWARIDYRADVPARLGGTLRWALDAPARLHGLLLWFVAELCGGAVISSAPDQPTTGYGQLFLPLLHPLHLVAGDEVEVQLEAIDLGPRYFWRWRTTTRASAAEGGPAAAFDQSSFHGDVLSPDTLRRHDAAREVQD